MHATTTEVTLDTLRAEIDRLDASLVTLLAERHRTVQQVGRLKAHAGLEPLDPAREARIVRRATEVGRALGLPEERLREVLRSVLALCRPGVRP